MLKRAQDKPKGYYKGEATDPSTVKFKTEFQGIPINIDRPKGFIMVGKDSHGNDWARRYKYDYGFIPKTLGGDGDGLDVFIGPDKKADEAYWAVQRKEDGSFDEYKCLLPGQELVGTIIGGSKSFYTGQVVKLRVASSKTLSVTPNHPILTLRGLIPASDLKKGDHLLTYDGEGELARSGDHKQNPPTVVEKVFSSLVELHPLGVSRKLVAPLDFHGDADGFQGEVEVVRTYRELRDGVESKTAQCVQKGDLVGPLSAKAGLVGGGSLHAGFQAEDSPGVGAPRPLGDAPPMLGQNLGGPSGTAQAQRFGKSPDVDLTLLKSVSDRRNVNAETIGDALRRLTSNISPDQVIDVELVHYSGHVFDFESTSGLIVANRVVISNCFLGFDNRDAAVAAYRDHIPKKFFKGIITMKTEMMKAMLGKVDPNHQIKRASAASFVDELGWLLSTGG